MHIHPLSILGGAREEEGEQVSSVPKIPRSHNRIYEPAKVNGKVGFPPHVFPKFSPKSPFSPSWAGRKQDGDTTRRSNRGKKGQEKRKEAAAAEKDENGRDKEQGQDRRSRSSNKKTAPHNKQQQQKQSASKSSSPLMVEWL